MNRLKDTLPKQTASALLLLVFLFIHAAKALHQHDRGHAKSENAANKITLKAKSCAVCDYHFTKDADAQFTFINIIDGQLPLPFYLYPAPQIITSVGLACSDRGPPVAV